MKQTANLNKVDGKVTMDREFEAMCALIPNGRYKVTIEKVKQRRSIPQNSLMWAWFSCIEEETGTPKQDVHDYYCLLFLPKIANINGKEVTMPGRTSDLNTEEMAEFMTKVQADAASELGITLPLPEDRFFEDFIEHYVSH